MWHDSDGLVPAEPLQLSGVRRPPQQSSNIASRRLLSAEFFLSLFGAAPSPFGLGSRAIARPEDGRATEPAGAVCPSGLRPLPQEREVLAGTMPIIVTASPHRSAVLGRSRIYPTATAEVAVVLDSWQGARRSEMGRVAPRIADAFLRLCTSPLLFAESNSQQNRRSKGEKSKSFCETGAAGCRRASATVASADASGLDSRSAANQRLRSEEAATLSSALLWKTARSCGSRGRAMRRRQQQVPFHPTLRSPSLNSARCSANRNG